MMLRIYNERNVIVIAFGKAFYKDYNIGINR